MLWNNQIIRWTIKEYLLATTLGLAVPLAFSVVFYLSTKAWVWTIVTLAKHWGFL